MRWPSVIGAVCLAMTVTLLHGAPTYWRADLDAVQRRRNEVFDSIQVLDQDIDSLDLRSGGARRLLSLGQRAPGFSVVEQADPGAFRAVPDSVGRIFDSVWARQPARDPSIGVVLRGSDLLRYRVTIHPIALDGVTCVRTTLLHRSETAQLAEHALGACGYYAAFGRPGPAIEQWFTRSSIGFRTNPPGWLAIPDSADWDRQLKAAWAHGGWALRLLRGGLPAPYEYSAGLARCVAGRSQTCADAALAQIPPSKLWWYNTFWGTDGGIGGLAVALMPDLVREFGPDRFRMFWRSSDAVPAAFQRAFGVSLDSWVRGEAISSYGPLELGAGDIPRAGVSALIWALIFLGLTALVARRLHY